MFTLQDRIDEIETRVMSLNAHQMSLLAALAIKIGLVKVPGVIRFFNGVSNFLSGGKNKHHFYYNFMLRKNNWQNFRTDFVNHLKHGKDQYGKSDVGGFCETELDVLEEQLNFVRNWRP